MNDITTAGSIESATQLSPTATATDPSQFGFMDLVFGHGDWVLQGAFLLLILMSIISWSIILYRAFYGISMRRYFKKHLSQICSNDYDSYAEVYAKLQGKSPVKEMLGAALKAQNEYHTSSHTQLQSVPYSDYLLRHIRHVYNRSVNALDGGLTILASIGATAPFVGLFGTVWGIYHALINIAMMGNINIATIAGPIGEALIATAVGLFVAIPAVLFYNMLNRRNRLFGRRLDTYAYDLYSVFLRQGKE